MSAPGGGVRARIAGKTVLAGRAGWLEENGVVLTEQAWAALASEQGGRTVVRVAVDGEAAGLIALKDTVKAGSKEAIARLRSLGLRPILVTGDNAAVAAQVARAVGIDSSNVQAGGATVAMAGDGVNDAAALAQADLGIAMGSDTDVAIAAADLTVMGSELDQVATAIELARRTLGTIKTNLFLGVLLQCGGHSHCRVGIAQPHAGRGRHGRKLRAGGGELATAAGLWPVTERQPRGPPGSRHRGRGTRAGHPGEPAPPRP